MSLKLSSGSNYSKKRSHATPSLTFLPRAGGPTSPCHSEAQSPPIMQEAKRGRKVGSWHEAPAASCQVHAMPPAPNESPLSPKFMVETSPRNNYFPVIEEDEATASPLSPVNSSARAQTSSAYDCPDPRAQSRNWNEDYQSLHDQAHPLFGPELTHVSTEFTDAALTYGRIIISESQLPDHLKTIKPVNFGGVAGGAKYVVHGILFKFAVDTQISHDPPVWLYGGAAPNDEAAIKAASQDLISRDRWMLKSFPSLIFRFPLLCLVTFKGYRLVAMSLLPVNETTLVYGSADGGRRVVASDPAVIKGVERVGAKLNLRPHLVGTTKLAGPGDMEVHLGTDGRYYMLDLARTMPCEAPSSRDHTPDRSIFYRLLRPVHVQNNPRPLNSDAFSAFNECDPNKEQHNADVVDATQRLYTKTIPAFAQDLEQRYGAGSMPTTTSSVPRSQLSSPFDQPSLFTSPGGLLTDGFALQQHRHGVWSRAPMRSALPSTPGDSLPRSSSSEAESSARAVARGSSLLHQSMEESEFVQMREQLQGVASWRLHKCGINCRQLGRIRAHLTSAQLRRVVLSVIVARCFKQMLDGKMRSLIREYAVPSDEPFKRLASTFFNETFHESDASNSLWNAQLKREIAQRFPYALTEAEQQSDYDLRSAVSLKVVFVMALELSAIRLGADCEHHLLAVARGERDAPLAFRDTDVIAIGSSVKMPMATTFGHALYLLSESLRVLATGDIHQARRLLLVAHPVALQGWRTSIEAQVQHVVLAIIENELACILPANETRALFESSMEAFGETVATWPQHSIYRIWETALERYVARCDRDLGREQAQSIRLFWQCNIQRACTEHPPVNIQVDATVIAEQVFGSLMQLMGAADNDM